VNSCPWKSRLSRWEKRGRGGSENESVKPLNGVQPVISGPVKAVAGGPVASIASRRATGGGEAYTARKQAVRIQLRNRFVIATPTPLAWRKAASGQPLTRGCSGVAGVHSPGHAFKGTPREPRRARYLSRTGPRFSPTRMEPGPEGNEGVPGKRTNPRRGVPATKGDQRWQERVGEQSYEPIVPVKVGTAGLPKGAATVSTGGKGGTGRCID
jgi:hypothetical protein